MRYMLLMRHANAAFPDPSNLIVNGERAEEIYNRFNR